MKYLLLSAALLCSICSIQAFAQQHPAGSPAPPEDVVKITTSLIRLDAVVTGKAVDRF